MRIRNLNNSAFSLLEILLASIIFIITIGGVFATINAVRAPVANKENELVAAVFGKQVLEALRSQVSAGQNGNFYTEFCPVSCADFTLGLGVHQFSLPNYGLSWPSTAIQNANSSLLTYTVTCADGSGSAVSGTPCSTADVARRVDLNINWPDAT